MIFLFHDRRNSNDSLTLSNIIFRREAFANLTGDANLLTKVKNANNRKTGEARSRNAIQTNVKVKVN